MERTEIEGQVSAPPHGDELERLRTAHRELERRLEVLGRHVALTSEEQLERTQLKKRKLLLKDRILLLETRGRA